MSEYNESVYIPTQLRDPHHEAAYCERIGKPSAQSMVFLLPDCYSNDIVIGDTVYDIVEVPRVVKIAHSYSQAEDAVTALNLGPEHLQKAKAAELVIDSLSSIPMAMRTAIRADSLMVLMGNPQLCVGGDMAWRDGYHMAYTQDYARPIAEVLEDFDVTNIEHVTGAMRLVDAFVDAQLLLMGYGMYEKTFKFTDNFGFFPHPEVFSTDLENMRLLDLGELSSDLHGLLKMIDDKEWENITERPEYTQLHPAIQAYFNKQCERAFTPATIMSIWHKKPLNPGMTLHEPLGEIYVFDHKLPPKLPRVLWEQHS